MRIGPTAIIFDYGNVLSQPQPLADIEAMASVLELPTEIFRRAYWQFRLAYDSIQLTDAIALRYRRVSLGSRTRFLRNPASQRLTPTRESSTGVLSPRFVVKRNPVKQVEGVPISVEK